MIKLLSIGLAGMALAAGAADPSGMNILFIDIEDCNAAALGCYGNPVCRTPNLDRFCKTAVRFDAAYVQAVCCNPSRTSFLTGLRPLSTRVTSNQHVMDESLPAGIPTLPELLKAGGFHTANIGKLFHTLEYAEKRYASFDRLEHGERPPGWEGPAPMLRFPPVARKDDPAPKDKASREYRLWKAANSDRYGDSGMEPEEEADRRKARTAVALLEEFARTKQRFFLTVAQSRPHTPLVAPKRYLEMYDPAKIADPPAPPDGLDAKFPYLKRARGGNPDIFTKGQPTPQQAREAIAAYYACLTFVDENIGLVLDALEKTGLADRTIVVFLGDHGFHLGDHGFWSKYSMLAGTHRAPLVVRVPGAKGNGEACPGIVEFVDLVPTLGELAGIPLPANLEGLSFAPLLQDPAKPWKKAAFLVDGDRSQVVRSRDFSYLQFTKNEIPVALFDLRKDPWETRNVADDPAYAAARREMADLLAAGWKAALP